MSVDAPESPPPARAAGAEIEPLLSLRGVEKSFGAVHVLRGVDLDVRPGPGHRTRRRQRRGQEHPDQGDRRHPLLRRRRLPLRGAAGLGVQPPRRQRPRHRGRLPGPRAVRQPRRRRQHVPRPRAQAPRHARQRLHGGAGPRDARRPLGAHPAVGAHAGGLALRRPAADRRDRPRRAVELPDRHPRRAHRRPRRRADRAGARAGAAARRQGPRRGADQPQPQRRLRGRRRHRGALPRPDGRADRRSTRSPATRPSS